MSSKKFRSMPPPPVPSQRSFAPGLAIRKPAVDPYNPTASTAAADTLSFFRTETEDESTRGTWTTIDPDTGTRTWDEEFHRQRSERGNDNSSVRSTSTRMSTATDSWMRWAEPSLPGLLGATSNAADSSRASSPDRTADTDAKSIDPDVRRLFVDTGDIMLDNTRPATMFEKRNQKSLPKGSATKIKNMIGNDLVSITHHPIDDRVKYRDNEGNYVDGIDRGKMKKRYEDEWRQRLDNRAAQMEHLTKIKLEWEALSPAEQAHRIAKREANQKLVNGLGAGLESRDDLYEFDEIPDIYRRTQRWTISGYSYKSTSTVKNEVRSTASNSSSRGVSNRHDHHAANRSRHGLQPRPHNHDARRRETSLGKRRTHDQIDNDAWSADNSFSPDTSFDYGYHQRYRDRDTYYREKRSPAGPRSQGSPSGPLAMRRSSYLHPTPSVASSGQYSGFSIPSQAIDKATSLGTVSYQSSKATRSVTSKTVATVDPDPALELALLQDLSARKENYDDLHDAIDKFDRVINASIEHGRIVQIKLDKLVHYGSSAVGDRIFSGRVQELQYFPAERMALVVFLVPEQAAAFVKHVRNLRENDVHEHRRLQINAEWYRGLETKAVYHAQPYTLASVLTDDASRVLHISHVPVEKKVQDFSDDLKLAFPKKIIVKVSKCLPSALLLAQQIFSIASLSKG